MRKLEADTHITFHRLRSSLPDRKNNTTYIRYDTDRGLILDPPATALLSELMTGTTLERAAARSHKSLAYVREFVSDLIHAGFVREIDGERVDDTEKRIEPWLAFIPRRYFSWVLAPAVVIPAFLIMVAGLVTAIFHTSYFPRVTDFFWSSNLFLSIAGIFVLNYALIFIHESAHYLTTRAVGGHARMLLDHQFTSVVVATEEYHISVLPKHAKYVTYVSGLFVDLFIIALIFLSYLAHDTHVITLGSFRPLLNVILLLQFNAIVWEFGTFLTTDVYYFLNDLADDDDLKTSTRAYLTRKLTNKHNPMVRLLRRLIHADTAQIVPIDRPGDYWSYIVFSTAGYLATLAISLFVTFPKYILFTLYALDALITAVPHGDAGVIVTSLLTLILINDHTLSLVFIFMRDKKI